jgi:hypothetical protein
MANYVDNEELRDFIIEYNNTNLEDDGKWLKGYSDRMTKKHSLGKLTDEKYDLAMAFVSNRIENTKKKYINHENMTDVEKLKYDARFKMIKDELWFKFQKIVYGRITSMRLQQTVKDQDTIDDIASDTVLAIFKYINRYDEVRATSAFAFVTQIAYNSIIASLNANSLRDSVIVTGLDFIENVNTLDKKVASYDADN